MEKVRHKIVSVDISVRGDGMLKIKTGYGSSETHYCRKSDIDKLQKFFSLEKIEDLEGKVFEFTSDRYYVRRNVFKHFLRILDNQ